MQNFSFLSPYNQSQDYSIPNDQAKQGKMTSDNSPEKSQIGRQSVFLQILSTFEKILKQFPYKQMYSTNSLTKYSGYISMNSNNQIQNFYQRRSQELQKICVALINFYQQQQSKRTSFRPQIDFSCYKSNLNYSLSEFSFSNEESQVKSTIKELEIQLSQYKTILQNYRQKSKEDKFKLQVQNDKLKEQIQKLKIAAELYQKKYEETLIKLSITDKINQSLQTQISHLKIKNDRSRTSSFTGSQVTRSYSKDKILSKNLIVDKAFYRLKNEESSKTKQIEYQQETVSKLIKELASQRKVKMKLQSQYNKILQSMLDSQKQLDKKNAIIHKLTTSMSDPFPKKIQRHSRVNTQSRYLFKKKFQHSRKSSFREFEKSSSNIICWNTSQTITLLNLLDDNLQIEWLNRIKVLFKLILYFQQKIQQQNYESMTIQDFSGININQHRFVFLKNNGAFSKKNKHQLCQLLKLNLCNIIDKLFQIPEIDVCPPQITKVLERFMKELDNFLDNDILQQVDEFLTRLKNFTMHILLEQAKK